MQIKFCGAAGGRVTGTRHLIIAAGRKILLDCGLAQGHREDANAENTKFRFDPRELDAVVLSHGHIDHSGNLPGLVKQGFAGPIYATPATASLGEPMLMDCAFLQEQDAEFWNKHHPQKEWIDPLYTQQDAMEAVARMRGIPYGETREIFPGVRVTLQDAGHVLGSAGILLEAEGKRLYFSGDLGRAGLPILRDPVPPPGDLDAMLIESTYGNRLHKSYAEADEKLAEIIHRTAARGGKVLIPTFALERTQELLYLLAELRRAKRIPEIPVVLDSPLATKLTKVFVEHPECYDDEMQRKIRETGGRALGLSDIEIARDASDSMALNGRHGPMVIMAASGMCEGGRILHHLRNEGGDHRNTILFVGYQAEGTLGRRILEGEEWMKIYGTDYPRRAEVAHIESFSAHADYAEELTWLRKAPNSPRKIFLVHGESDAEESLRGKVHDALPHAEIHIPELGEMVEV